MEYLESLFTLKGKVAVVIGGTGELCGAMAEGLAGAGCEVVLVGRNEEKLRTIAERHDLKNWTTDVDETLANPDYEVYFDALVTKARRVTDQGTRAELYRQAQAIFRRELPWVPIAHSAVFVAARREVTGYRMDPLGRHIFRGVGLREAPGSRAGTQGGAGRVP